MRLAHIDGGWRLDHALFGGRARLAYGAMHDDERWIHHGTAALAQIIGRVEAGGGGVVRCVDAVYCCAIFGPGSSVAGAIGHAVTLLDPGDVVLVGVQAPGAQASGLGSYGFVPAEFAPDVFDAIRAATDRGIIVVEPAGNGAVDLDAPIHDRRFDRARCDSGAIIVGAGASADRTRLAFSNWGSRVDLQEVGDRIATAYTDRHLRSDPGGWTTERIAGTSGAAPLVAGAAAVLQGIARRRGRVLAPSAVRDLLVATGAPQGASPASPVARRIGPRPDLGAAIVRLDALLGRSSM